MFEYPKAQPCKCLTTTGLERQLFPTPTPFYPSLPFAPAVSPPPLNLVMPCQRNARCSIELSPTSAFDMCDGLLRMSFHLMIQLPEAELRDIHYVIDTLLTRADQLLDMAGPELSLNFTALAIDLGKSHILLTSFSVFRHDTCPFQSPSNSRGPRTSVRFWSQPRPLSPVPAT
jgi:hypothetical protein